MAQIEIESNAPPWSETLFSSEFSNPHSFSYGVRSSGVLAGAIVCHAILDEGHIMTFGVRKEFRGKGLGKALLIHALRELYQKGVRWITLEVRRSNGVARALYEGLGFREVSMRKEYYSDNREDALVLKLELTQFVHEFGGE